MAATNVLAILRAVRDRIAGSGTFREINPDRFRGGQFQGQETEAALIRAIGKPSVGVEVVRLQRHKDSPPIEHDTALMDIGLRVDVRRAIAYRSLLKDEYRDAIVAFVAEDADLIRQALEAPEQMVTGGGVATGLASGMLLTDGTPTFATEITGLGDARAASRVARIPFRGIVQVTQQS